MSDKHESLIRAQAYLDAKQSMTTRTGKNTKGKLNCSAGNKQCGGRCIPEAWDCRLEGKGTNSELKAHQFDPLGGVSSVQRGVETIAKNPGDPKSWDRGRNSIIRGIVKGTPGDNLEEKKKLKRRLQKYGNQIGAVVMSGIAIGATHAFMKKVNPRYRRGLGNQIDRAAFSAVDQVLNRLPVIGPERQITSQRAGAVIGSLNNALSYANNRDRLEATAGKFRSSVRMSPVGLPPGGTDFNGAYFVPPGGKRTPISTYLQNIQREARAGGLSFEQWQKKATQAIYGAETGVGNQVHSVFSDDAANRFISRQFGAPLPEGTLRRRGIAATNSQAAANNETISAVAERLKGFGTALRDDMALRRYPREKNGSYSSSVVDRYVESVVLPQMGIVQSGMTAAAQNQARSKTKALVGQVIRTTSDSGYTAQAKALRNAVVANYDKYFRNVSDNMLNTQALSRDFLNSDGVVGTARYFTFQQPITGERPPSRIVSRDHGRLILRDYFERKVMGDKNRTFTAGNSTVQRVAGQLTRSAPVSDTAQAYSILRESGIRGLSGPAEIKTSYGAKTPKRSTTRKPKPKTGKGMSTYELAKRIMARKGWTGTTAQAIAQAKRELQERGDDEHMSPTITKRNPPEPLVTNSTPTVVNGPTSTEHLPKDEDEMVTPLMPVSKMSESPSPKEAEEIAQEAQEEPPKPSGKPIKLSLSIEIPAEALAAKRSDAYEAEKLRLREDTTSGKSKGKACGESHIPSKHECTIGTGGAALKDPKKGKTESFQHTNEKGERTAAYRARQFGSALARAGFTVGTGYAAFKTKDKDPVAAAGLALMSLTGAKSLKRELQVTRSTKDLVNDFSALKKMNGVEPETIDQMTTFVQEAGIDVQRVQTMPNLMGINGYFVTDEPNRVRTSTAPTELKNSRTRSKEIVTGGTPAEQMTTGVQKMIKRRQELYNSPEDRSRLLAKSNEWLQNEDDLFEMHTTGQYVGSGKGRALYTNAHEIAHAIHYRSDFATPKSVTVKGKVYSGNDLEVELLKSSSYYAQADIRRKPISQGKPDDYYETGSRLETYAENYAMYVGGGKAMKEAFPVSYEWTKQTTDYALSKPVNKPPRTMNSVVKELMENEERKYIGDRMDAPKEKALTKPLDNKGKFDLYLRVQKTAVAGDVKGFMEAVGEAKTSGFSDEEMTMLGDYAETVMQYESLVQRSKPENQSTLTFQEAEDGKKEEKTDARRDAYMATRFAWT